MSNPVDALTAPPKAAFSFAKSKPLAFAVLALVVILLTIRFAAKVVPFLVGLPGVGKFFAKAMNVKEATS